MHLHIHACILDLKLWFYTIMNIYIIIYTHVGICSSVTEKKKMETWQIIAQWMVINFCIYAAWNGALLQLKKTSRRDVTKKYIQWMKTGKLEYL